LALKNDGTVWAWGYNANGRLGDGTGTQRLSPVQVVLGSGASFTGVIAIAAEQSGSMALKSDGTVWMWGYGGDGELGNGATTQSLTPVQVTGLAGVVSIAAGANHGMALKNDGTVWTWGYNGQGQLGDGSTTSETEIVSASSLTGMVAIAGGMYHSLAVKSDGTVWAWGYNNFGQLGNASVTESTTPVQVTGLTSGGGVAAGLYHSIAFQSDGSIWSWGNNAQGQFGVAAPASSTVPIPALLHFLFGGLPTVSIDAPAPNAVVSGTVTVSGWAVDNATTVGTAIGSVVVKVDDVVIGNATYGLNRADVCGAYPGRPGCPNVGYTFALNTSGLSAGTHTIMVYANDTDGAPLTGSASVTVTVGTSQPPIVSLDAPAANSTISGTVAVSGWALDNSTAIGSVVVKVDGLSAQRPMDRTGRMFAPPFLEGRAVPTSATLSR
jgi:hypothetical protein